MTWKHHINHVNKKISRALFIIKQVKNLLPLDCLRTLYFALIHPHLSYGITACGNASLAILKRTNILQKRAIRTICRAKYNSHTEPLFKQLNILKLTNLYEYEATILMFKFVHNKLPLSFKYTFKLYYEVQSSQLTRRSALIYIKRCDSNFARKLPLFAFPIIWNNWSPKIPFIVSKACVKKLIKHSLIYSFYTIIHNKRQSFMRQINPSLIHKHSPWIDKNRSNIQCMSQIKIVNHQSNCN